MRFLNPMRRIVPVLLAAILILPAAADYKQINTPNPDDQMDVSIFELANGLKVYLTENHETPRFYAEIAVRAGSKHDPAESTGLAHYLEHMLFKGTSTMGTLDYSKEKEYQDKIEELYEQHFVETDMDKRAALYQQINEATVAAAEYAVPNEIDKLYKSTGGSGVNAHTWHEETVYKVELPSNRVRQWAAIESERFREPVFRLFVTELEAVYEEMNRALDNKDRIISYAVNEQLFKEHPYGQQPTLGLVEHLKNPSLKNIGEFFDTYYVPNNMAIFISGDIDTEETIEIIDENFSSWEAKPLPKPGKWREKDLDGREVVKRSYEGEEYVQLAFRTVAHDHKDAEALQLVDMILDNATAGLINLNLNQQQRVRAAGSYPAQYNDYGAQYLWGVPKDGQTMEEVEQLLLEQVEIVKRGEFEDWILPAIINDFKKNEKGGLESDYARVSAMRDTWLGFEDWDHRVARIARMETITKKDVVRVAKKYFGEDYVAGFREDAPHEVPDIHKPELATIQIDPQRQSAFAKEILAMPYEPIAPSFIDPATDYQIIENPNGVKLYYAPNPINDIFSFNISVEFGTHQDNTIGTAFQLLDKSGTAEFSAEDLKKEWYKLGTNMGAGAGDNESSISLSGLDENFEASFKLLMELIHAPSADAETLDELKKIILVAREDAKKQQPSIHSALVQYNRYGADSFYLRLLPKDALLALSVDELHAVISKLLDYKHVISYTGSLPLEEVQAILDRHHPITGELKDPPPYQNLSARRPDGTEIYLVDKEGAKADIRLEFGTVTYDPALATPVALYNNYFAGGMAGIVFQELREARGLAYSAGARYVRGYRAGDEDIMLGAIQTQTDKTVDSTVAFVELLDALPESPERFAVTLGALENQYRTEKTGFRGIIGAVRNWERHGLEPDPRREWFAQLQSATLDDVLAFHKDYIANQPKLISIVGDAAKIDLEALGKLGTIKKIDASEIFVD